MQKKVSTILRCAVWKGEASLAVLDMTDFTAQTAARHGLSPSAARVLGRLSACAAYLCSWIEEDERLSVVAEGGGVLGKIHAFGNGALRLCASVENSACREELSAEELVGGRGYLTVTRDGGRGIPFSGTCALVNGNIADDIEAYLSISEQRPTAVAFFEEEKGGKLTLSAVFIQPLTGAPARTLARAREALKQIEGKTAGEIAAFFGAENVSVREIVFACSCSREKAERAILSAGRTCADHILKEEGVITVHCHECNTDYSFYENDVRALFER